MNLIIGVRSAWAAPAACRKAFVAANIFEYRSVRSGNVIDLQQMMLKLRFLGLSDKETLGANMRLLSVRELTRELLALDWWRSTQKRINNETVYVNS
jgi:hypothetical protein